MRGLFGEKPKPKITETKTNAVPDTEIDDTTEFLQRLVPKLVKAGAKPDTRTSDQIINDRIKEIQPGMVDTHFHITDEEYAARDARQTPTQELTNAQIARQVAIKEEKLKRGW